MDTNWYEITVVETVIPFEVSFFFLSVGQIHDGLCCASWKLRKQALELCLGMGMLFPYDSYTLRGFVFHSVFSPSDG
jgi:hypothetical protein